MKLLLHSNDSEHYRYDTIEERNQHIIKMEEKGYDLWNYYGNGTRGNWYGAIFNKRKE